MGRSSRAKRIRKFDKAQHLEIIGQPIELHEDRDAQSIEQSCVTNDCGGITDVVPIMNELPAQQKTTLSHNPNSASALLNSILTTLLTQEYNRLQQQLMNIKRQLDEQKVISGEVVQEKDANKNDQNDNIQ